MFPHTSVRKEYLRKIKDFGNPTKTTIAYECINKLSDVIRAHKDKLPHDARSNVVYKLECSNCPAI